MIVIVILCTYYILQLPRAQKTQAHAHMHTHAIYLVSWYVVILEPCVKEVSTAS